MTPKQLERAEQKAQAERSKAAIEYQNNKHAPGAMEMYKLKVKRINEGLEELKKRMDSLHKRADACFADAVSPVNKDKLEKLSENALRSERQKWDTKSGEIGKKIIAEGRGSERYSETKEKAAKGDVLAKDYITASENLFACAQEMDARYRYQGNYKPIKRKQW